MAKLYLDGIKVGADHLDSIHEFSIKRADVSDEDAAIISKGEPMTIFSAKKLATLKVDGFQDLTQIHSTVGKCTHLLQLTYIRNGLLGISPEISQLASLSYLDLTENKLSEVPLEVYSIKTLQTLILARNHLTDASFPPPPEDLKPLLPELRHVDLSHNKMSVLPAWLGKVEQVTELLASDNEISSLCLELLMKGHLRVLDLSRNKIKEFPYELTELKKIKTLLLVENPVSDRRLLKLIVQHGDTKPKSVLDYLGTHASKARSSDTLSQSEGRKELSKKSKGQAVHPRHLIKVVRNPNPLVVQATKSVRAHRPYMVCTIIRKLDLLQAKDIKKFLAVQTAVHEGAGNKRKLAAIATHNVSLLTPPLVYDARPLGEVLLIPIGYENEMSAKEFLDLLETNRAPSRGGKRSAAVKKTTDPQAAALSKYLGLVQGHDKIALLEDGDKRVLSLPPLTNCAHTMLTEGVHDVLVEVTSSRSLQGCKTVLDGLIMEMLQRGMKSREKEKGSDAHSDTDDLEVLCDDLQEGIQSWLCLEQVRVTDENGTLLSVYPSRTDLQFDLSSVLVQGF